LCTLVSDATKKKKNNVIESVVKNIHNTTFFRRIFQILGIEGLTCGN